jgi:hypothetical protein
MKKQLEQDLADKIEIVREREKGKVSLRVNKQTMILVHKHNRTKQYAEGYLKKLEERKLNW